ncbi:hypothetical protein HRG84_03695 [Flavisolibacter sp. BT320]|nr:hypothetical protein [Flavisolibacter longurius]
MKYLLTLALLGAISTGCNSGNEQNKTAQSATLQNETAAAAAGPAWRGTISNGMKGDAISFDVKGNELQNLTFEGYWRCSGRLDQATLGPEESLSIKNGVVDGVITEPKSGFRFEVKATIKGNKAEGTIRFSNVGAGCDTYKLNWTAAKK